MFTWRVLSGKSVFPHRTIIIPLSFLTYNKDELYHKLYHFMCHYHYSFCFYFFFLYNVLLFFSVLSPFFFFRNFSPFTLLQFIALDWLLDRVNTQYSLLSFTWGWLSLNYKFIWNFDTPPAVPHAVNNCGCLTQSLHSCSASHSQQLWLWISLFSFFCQGYGEKSSEKGSKNVAKGFETQATSLWWTHRQ